MRIKALPIKNHSDQGIFRSKFESFGPCSIVFKVRDMQSDEILVTFGIQEQAQEAYRSLNGASFREFQLSLELITEERFDSHLERSKNDDIEIIIPTKQINFLSTPSCELTPTSSYHSPFFPNNTQSPIDSPRNSPPLSDYMQMDSPVSVSRLPISESWKTSPHGNFLSLEETKIKFPDKYEPPLKRRCESISLAFPKKPKPEDSDMTFCSICQKSIKKKSLRAHNSSKLHRSNSRILNE
jgi:hypothetical protein